MLAATDVRKNKTGVAHYCMQSIHSGAAAHPIMLDTDLLTLNRRQLVRWCFLNFRLVGRSPRGFDMCQYGLVTFFKTLFAL